MPKPVSRGPDCIDPAQLLGRLRAAALLDVNPQTIDKFIRQGQLPAFRIGRRVLVRRSDLMALLERNGI